MDLEDLYQEILLDHYRNPRGASDLPHVPLERAHENPNCGDVIKLELETDGEVVQTIRFEVRGCAISTASASMMSELLSGEALAEARRRVEAFIRILRGEEPADALEDWGDLACLKGVIQYPLRVKCATLAWHALREELDRHLGAG